MASRFSLCRASCGRIWMNINRVTLQHNKEFITVIFYLMVLSMCNLQKRLIRAAFWVLPQRSVSLSDWKQTAQWLKLQERLRTINKRNRIRWNIYRDNNFHSRRQVSKCLVKILSLQAFKMHQSIPPAPSPPPPPPPRATAGHLPDLSVPGVGHLQILHCPGTGHLPGRRWN